MILAIYYTLQELEIIIKLVRSYHFILLSASHVPEVDHKSYFVVCCFTLPFAGWLADVHLGRYKVLRWSIWIMWIVSVLATVSSVAEQMVNSYQHIDTNILLVLLAIASGLM